MKDAKGEARWRQMRRYARLTGRLIRGSTRGAALAGVRQRLAATLSRAPLEVCVVCGSRAARVVAVTDATQAGRALARPPTFRLRICRVCGHVGNPENTFDYRGYDRIDDLTEAVRIGTRDRQGREFHMAQMAIDILARDDLDVLIYGAGRSFDNHHIAALAQVRAVAIADIMRLRDDAEFVDALAPAPRPFDVVVASEVVEHFLDPRPDFARLLDFVADEGLLVCSTNLYDGGWLGKQSYVFVRGHTSYYTAESLARIARLNGALLDIRIPLVATGYGGPRKRYVLLTRSPAVIASIARYFATRQYAPSESPSARADLAAAEPAVSPATEPVTPGG